MTRGERIEAALAKAFSPAVLHVENESHKHSVKPGSETHFHVVLVTEAFAGRSRVDRHRQVNAVLAEELAGGLHALSLRTLTPEEWAAAGGEVPGSPACRGGGT